MIIFTGLLTVLWLRKRLEWFKWLGMVVILGGLAVVGVGDLKAPQKCFSANLTSYQPEMSLRNQLTNEDELCAENTDGAGEALYGNLLIVAAQV